MSDMTWSGTSTSINVNELTEKIRMEAQEVQGIAQIASPPTGQALGLGAGDTGQYTYFQEMDETQGGQLSEAEPIPTDGVTPIKATFTVQEYGHGIAYTGKLRDLARLEMDDVHMKSLDAHRRKLENSQVYTELGSTDWKMVFHTTATSYEFVTNGTATQNTNNSDLDLRNLSLLSMEARKRKIPFWDGESYVYVTGPESIEALESDSDLTTLLKEDSGRAALNGAIGRVKRCIVVEDNHKIADHPQSFDEGFLCGADAVVNEVALPWEMRFEVSDFGRSKKLAYYGIMDWFKVLDQTTHSQEHIIHVTAAA